MFEVTTRSQMDDQFVPEEQHHQEDSGIANCSSDCPLTLAIQESKRLIKTYEDELKALRHPKVKVKLLFDSLSV